MSEYALRLYDELHATMVSLRLHSPQDKPPLSQLMEIPQARVYFDREYYAQLMSPSVADVRSFEFLLNGYPIPCVFSNSSGRIRFRENAYAARIFADCFGLCEIQLRFVCREGAQSLVSESMQVMIQPGEESVNVNSIGSYTALHNRFLLYGTTRDYLTRQQDSRWSAAALEDKMRLLKQTVELLKKNWQALRASSRMEQPHTPPQSPYAQLLTLTGQTGQESRPLHEANAYEYGVIHAFLHSISQEIARMIPQVSEILDALPEKVFAANDYISSSAFLSSGTVQALRNVRSDLEALQSEYAYLSRMFAQLVPMRAMPLLTMPRPTAAFVNLPAFRPVYQAISAWFSLAQAGVSDLRFLSVYLHITTLYEVYVLTKLRQFLSSAGFSLVSAHRHVYECAQANYENTPVNNTFLFVREEFQIELFYQPVLVDGRKKEAAHPGLYRSTSLSFPRLWGESAHGRYYTPDYIIQIRRTGCAASQYILADAKYADLANVRSYKTIPLVYKYLFSLSVLHAQDEISGLYLFYGKRRANMDAQPLAVSLYDMAPEPESVFPQVEMVALAQYPGIREQDQFETLRRLFALQIDHYNSRLRLPDDNPFTPDDAENA